MLFIRMGFQRGSQFYLSAMRFVWYTYTYAHMLAPEIFFINSKMWTLLCNVLFVLKISALFGWNSAFNTNFSMQSIILLYSGALYSMQSRQFRLYNNRFVATYILDISFRLLGLFSLLSLTLFGLHLFFYVHFYFFWFLFILFDFFVLLPLECRYMIFNLHWL